MRIPMLFVLLFPLLAGQEPENLPARIRASHLPEEQRNELAADFAAKNYAHAEEVLERQAAAAGTASETAELYAMAGDAAFLHGRMDRAIVLLRQADSKVPLAETDRFTLAMALASMGDADAARAQLTRLNTGHPDRPLYIYWLARLDYYQRLYQQAVEKLKQVIALDPTSVRAYNNLALAYDMMGESEQARDVFVKAVELNRKLPNPSPWPPHDYGYLLLRLQRLKEAETFLRESLKYDPQLGTAHYHLGRTLEAEDRDDEAIGEYRAAISLDPTLIEALYSLGQLYRRDGQAAEAQATFAEYKKRKALGGQQ